MKNLNCVKFSRLSCLDTQCPGFFLLNQRKNVHCWIFYISRTIPKLLSVLFHQTDELATYWAFDFARGFVHFTLHFWKRLAFHHLAKIGCRSAGLCLHKMNVKLLLSVNQLLLLCVTKFSLKRRPRRPIFSPNCWPLTPKYIMAFPALKYLTPLTLFTTVIFVYVNDGFVYDWIKKSELQMHCFEFLEN